jgi:fibronectin-binding autotransporter adhesin
MNTNLTWELSLTRRGASRTAWPLTLALALLAQAAFAAQWAWNTAPNSATFSGANWTSGTTPGSGTGTPSSGDSLYFGTSSQLSPNNDFSAYTFGGITFNSGASVFSIGGNQFTLASAASIVNSSSSAEVINNNIILGGAGTVSASGGNLALGGIISDGSLGYNLTLNGGKTVTLSGANTFGGTLTINSGTTLSIGAAGNLGSGTAISFGGSSTSTFSAWSALIVPNTYTITVGSSSTGKFTSPTSGNALQIAAKITGAGGCSHGSGSGTVRFSNDNNDYTGNFSTGYGTVEYTSVANGGSPSALGAGATSYTLGNSSSGLTFRYVGSGNTSTTRAINNTASTGYLTFDNTGTGSVQFLATGNLRSTGSGAVSLTFQGTSTGANTFAQVINDSTVSGATTVSKAGIGTWVLTGANTYSGTTTVSAGTLLVNSPGSIAASSAVTVAATGTLGGNGTINGTVSVTAGGILTPGNSSIGTLTLAKNSATSLTLNGNTIKCKLSNVVGTSDQIAITGASGTLVLNGANTIALSFPNGTAPAGTYTLMTYSAKTGSGTFALDRTYPNATLNTGSTSVTLTVTGAGTAAPLTWVGDGTANAWDTTTANWTTGSGAVSYADPAQVTFGDTGSAAPAINISGTVNPYSVTVNTSTKSYTIGGAAIDGTASLTKSGTTTLLLTGVNTYSGGTTISAGALMVTNDSGLGNSSGGISFTGSATLAATNLAAAANSPVTIGSSRTITINNTFTANFYTPDTNNLTIAAYVTGAGAVSKRSSSYALGTVRFSNDANDYTGDFSMGYGNAEFTSVANQGVASSLGTGGTITLANGISSGTFRYVGTANSSTTRPLNWTATGSGIALDNTGSGTVQYLATGNLRSGSGGAVGLTLQGTNTGPNTLAQVINDLNGVTTVTKSGTGAWVLTGANTYSGSTTISGGNLSVSSDANLGTPPVSATPGSLAITAGALSSSASFTLNANRGIALGPTTGSGGGTLDVAGGTTLVYGGIIANNGSGVGALSKTSAGTLTLSGVEAYTGYTMINAGTLALSTSGSIATSPRIIVAAGATLDVSGVGGGYTLAASQTLYATNGVTVTVNGNLSLGSSALVMTNVVNTPTITVTGGTLTLASGNAVTVNINNGGNRLEPGNYKLVSKGAGGAVGGTVPATVTVGGNGIAVGTTARLQILSDELYLTVNTPPVAQDITMGALSWQPSTIQIIGGKYNPTDADGDPVTVTAVQAPLTSGFASTDGTGITYTPTNAAPVTNSFTYTVSDSWGATDTKTITVWVTPQGEGFNRIGDPVLTNGLLRLSYAGIPTYPYALDTASDLSAMPVLWTPLLTNTADSHGAVIFEITPASDSGYFRTRTP